MRVSYDRDSDAVWISLTDRPEDLPGPASSVAVEAPENPEGSVVLDFKFGKLVGIEVLSASSTLPDDLLSNAENQG